MHLANGIKNVYQNKKYYIYIITRECQYFILRVQVEDNLTHAVEGHGHGGVLEAVHLRRAAGQRAGPTHQTVVEIVAA